MALAYEGALTVQELLASTRLLRLAVEVLQEREQQRQEQEEEERWKAQADARLNAYG